MAIIERFDGFANYLYPMLTNTSRQHRVFRDTMIAAIFEQYRLFHAAAKSGQASRLYEADAGLAYLKELLRFSHWSVQPWNRGVNFCGYRIWPTHKLLRRSSVTRAKHRLSELEKSGDWLARNQFLAAWRGHARWADSHNLMISLGVTKK